MFDKTRQKLTDSFSETVSMPVKQSLVVSVLALVIAIIALVVKVAR